MSENLPAYYFHQGTNFKAYEYLGVHIIDGRMTFRVWAPNAESVSLCGDFDSWGDGISMSRITDGGIWEAVTDILPEGTRYKFRIRTRDGRELMKADPYAFFAEKPPETASVICHSAFSYEWGDAAWMTSRPLAKEYGRPINVYEVHLGSWKRHEDGSYLSYKELADELLPYVKQMGYTHIELMPVAEHPFDGSWGYQVTGYFAPTSRYGRPDEFCAFVDAAHRAGIGIILDWVPAHFPKDAHGLYEFDGMPLYEYQGWDRVEHAGWGTRRFDVGRPEVQSFLVSNATYWAEIFHVDGIRVDAVASMLYLDYDRRPDEWVPNVYGDNRCLEAIAFFKKLNSHLSGAYPALMMIAEESAAALKLTGDAEDSLGFTYKWNMGWMNDNLSYAETDPIFRKYHHDKLTFSLIYSFDEKYMLPISHDEVVHGKKSYLDRHPGDYWNKFAGARGGLCWMMLHPGKKLLFMGTEYGPFREWAYEESLEWFMLDYEMHAKFQHFTADLNHLYLSSPELWARDLGWDGFEWIDADNAEGSVIVLSRSDGKGRLLAVINFSPVYYPEYRVGVPVCGEWREVFSSDRLEYGGGGVTHEGMLRSENVPMHGREESLCLRVAPHGAHIFRLEKEIPHKVPNTASEAANINSNNINPKGRNKKQCSRKKNV